MLTAAWLVAFAWLWCLAVAACSAHSASHNQAVSLWASNLSQLEHCSGSIEALASAAFCLSILGQSAWSKRPGGNVWDWQGKAPGQLRQPEAPPRLFSSRLTLCEPCAFWGQLRVNFGFEAGDNHSLSLHCHLKADGPDHVISCLCSMSL